LLALALSRSGASRRANALLTDLYREGARDGETLGLLARTYKDLADRAAGEAQEAFYRTAAYQFYEEGYTRARDAGNDDEAFYTGINAATLALLRQDHETSAQIAEHVRAICENKLGDPSRRDPDSYWLHATLGEAALLRGDL
jgi:predicted Zn-dependent protease